MPPFSVVFCGTPNFAVPSLRALANDPSFDIQLVVTQPDRPVGRKQEMASPSVKVEADILGLRTIQPEHVNDELLTLIEHEPNLRPDFLVVVAYGELLSEKILSLPTIAPVNVHGSVLPRWRGASPVEHAILHDDKETGVTVQVMVKELDAGPILSVATLPIEQRDTALILREKLSEMGAALLINTLKQPLKPIPQATDGITICTKLKKEDGFVDPLTMSAADIDRKVRALVPWPGVTMKVDGNDVKILKSELEPQPNSVALTCAGNTTLHLVAVQPAGKKEMSGQDWQRGLKK